MIDLNKTTDDDIFDLETFLQFVRSNPSKATAAGRTLVSEIDNLRLANSTLRCALKLSLPDKSKSSPRPTEEATNG